MNTEDQEQPYGAGDWVALTRNFTAPYIIPVRVGKEPTVPFGAVGKVTQVAGVFDGQQTYNIVFHAGWTALGVPHKVLRPARTLEQLALCADGC